MDYWFFRPPITGSVAVTAVNLTGDGQADLIAKLDDSRRVCYLTLGLDRLFPKSSKALIQQ